MSTGYKYIKDKLLVADCQYMFDLAVRGKIPHEEAEAYVYKWLQADTNTRKEVKQCKTITKNK